MKIYALLSFPDYGYTSDREAIESLEKGRFYEVKKVSMGQSHTSIYLKEITGCYNSVNFTFYDENKQPIDLRDCLEFNPYLEKKLPDYIVVNKALELACEWIAQDHHGSVESCVAYFLERAKEAVN